MMQFLKGNLSVCSLMSKKLWCLHTFFIKYLWHNWNNEIICLSNNYNFSLHCSVHTSYKLISPFVLLCHRHNTMMPEHYYKVIGLTICNTMSQLMMNSKLNSFQQNSWWWYFIESMINYGWHLDLYLIADTQPNLLDLCAKNGMPYYLPLNFGKNIISIGTITFRKKHWRSIGPGKSMQI